MRTFLFVAVLLVSGCKPKGPKWTSIDTAERDVPVSICKATNRIELKCDEAKKGVQLFQVFASETGNQETPVLKDADPAQGMQVELTAKDTSALVTGGVDCMAESPSRRKVKAYACQ